MGPSIEVSYLSFRVLPILHPSFAGHWRRTMLRPFRPHGESFVVARPPLPARLLRRILIDGNHHIGEHLLVAGNHSDEMAEWLDELGFDVDAIDDSMERISARQA